MLRASAERRVIVVDGFITSAAVLVASRIAPQVLQRCVFAHRSGERGHSLMLAQMQAEPLLDLGLRLGEGSGAALAWPLLQSACAVLREMASFESAGAASARESIASRVSCDPDQLVSPMLTSQSSGCPEASVAWMRWATARAACASAPGSSTRNSSPP